MEAPAHRAPAPAPLDLVEAFINTADLERDADEIATPAALKQWLVARKLIEPSQRVTQADFEQVLELRDALRRATRANCRSVVDRGAVEELNHLALRGSLVLAFGKDGTAHLAPASNGLDGAQARILAAVAEAVLTGKWVRLKSCANDGCQWAFYDASKNRSGRWCDMEDCGNEAKGRAFRNRRRSAPKPARRAG